MVRGYEDSLGNMVFEVEPNFKMDSVKPKSVIKMAIFVVVFITV